MDPDRSKRHEAFVKNIHGSSIKELLCLLVIPNALGFIRVRLEQVSKHQFTKFERYELDVFFLFLAFLLPPTLWSDYILEITVISCGFAGLLYAKTKRHQSSREKTIFPDPLRVWRRALRAYILFYTCLCIYAVDFPIFPRRLAKTELYGVSLMDTGVGLISLSCGVSNVSFLFACRSISQSSSRRLFSGITISTAALLGLGASRTIAVKALGYPEQVTEYGVHWNFFVTLTAMRLFGFAICFFLRRFSELSAIYVSTGIALVLTIGHQLLLWAFVEEKFQLTSPLLTAEMREFSLLLANAEGILSLPGYLALYMWGFVVGVLVTVQMGPSPVKFKCLSVQGADRWRGDVYSLAKVTGVFSLFALGISVYCGAESISRRFVNMPFITLQISIGGLIASFFLICMFGDRTNQSDKPNGDIIPMVSLVCDNSMSYFLISNLATGLLNMSIDTLELSVMEPTWLSSACQFALLTVYAIACPFLAEFFRRSISAHSSKSSRVT